MRADSRPEEFTIDATTSPATSTGALTPILPGMYPDPTICRVGDDYYLAASSFEYFPGAPLFHSRDLVTWVQVGNILDRRTQFRRGRAGASLGIYASTLRHHQDTFWFVTTNVADFESGQVIVHTTDPTGPWSDPLFVPEATGIDPDLCWDDDGTCYLTWKLFDETTGESGIRQAPIDLVTGKLIEPPYPVWQGMGLLAEEAPHLYRIGEYWYITLAEGGTERGHCVTIARGPSPRGPFEPCPENPVFTHRNTIHPVQSVGHADLVQTTDGSWAAVHLGTRPQESLPGFHLLGRETFVVGIDWKDGWPAFVEDRFEIPPVGTTFHEAFLGPGLHPRWVMPEGDPGESVQILDGGGISMRRAGSPPLCFRVRDFAWTADVTAEGDARVELRVDDRHRCGLELDTGAVRAFAIVGDVRQDSDAVAVETGRVVLRIRAVPPAGPHGPMPFAPDHIALEFSTGGPFRELLVLDGRYFSTEVAMGFTGRVLGISTPGSSGCVHSVSYQAH